MRRQHVFDDDLPFSQSPLKARELMAADAKADAQAGPCLQLPTGHTLSEMQPPAHWLDQSKHLSIGDHQAGKEPADKGEKRSCLLMPPPSNLKVIPSVPSYLYVFHSAPFAANGLYSAPSYFEVLLSAPTNSKVSPTSVPGLSRWCICYDRPFSLSVAMCMT